MTPGTHGFVDATPLIRRAIRDDSLTRGLGDEEARMLVDWVATWAEVLAAAAPDPPTAAAVVDRLARRGRSIGRFVRLWTDPRTRRTATQLAAVERFGWPLPTRRVEAADLMHHALTWERADYVGRPTHAILGFSAGSSCRPRPVWAAGCRLPRSPLANRRLVKV